jgi:L-lysine exporter family protein LysE/ArgO
MIAFLPGFFTGLSLIVAIGAQNAFVIRQGLTRKHVLLVVAICAIADALLIFAGIAGLGAVISSLPWLLELIRWLGAAYLVWFGIRSLIAAAKNQSMDASGGQSVSRAKVITSVLGFTLLNPHVYLDTVILVGGVANQFADHRWVFGAGAATASLVWFAGIGFGAKSAAGIMAKPVFWRVLDVIIAAIMFSVAGLLLFYKF